MVTNHHFSLHFKDRLFHPGSLVLQRDPEFQWFQNFEDAWSPAVRMEGSIDLCYHFDHICGSHQWF
jgi:hypothetical protein